AQTRTAKSGGARRGAPTQAAEREEDRFGRGGPLGREHEGRQAGGVARDADQEGRRPPPQARPEDGEERHRRGRRAVERDLERRLGEELDADAAGGPEQGAPRARRAARARGAALPPRGSPPGA